MRFSRLFQYGKGKDHSFPPTGELIAARFRRLTRRLFSDFVKTAHSPAKMLINFPTWLMQHRQTIFSRAVFRRLRQLQPITKQFYDITSSTCARAFAALVTFEPMEQPRESPPPEDTVFYKLFPARSEREEAGEEPDLTCLAVKCSELARQLAREHVWHYRPFELEVCHHVTRGMRGMCLFISPKGLVTGNGGRTMCVVARGSGLPCFTSSTNNA